MHSIFYDYAPYAGPMRGRGTGSLTAWEPGMSTAYALFNAQERGRLFISPGVEVYEGMIVGQCAREGDLPINVAKIFVNQAGFVPQSGLTDQVYQKALQFYWEGDYKNALKEFKTVIEFYPRHPVAERYILECTENVTKGLGKSAGLPSWLKWILIIIAAVAVIAVIVVLLSKRSSGGPAKPKKGLGYLYGQAGTLAGNKFMVEKTGLRLGRDPARCQIVIQEDVISREHAVIEPTPDGKAVRVRNLSATNPTYVNERAVTEVELKEGDQVRIGKTVFIYKIE